jgi:p-cumate 2,3-dioxygenase beta subunit
MTITRQEIEDFLYNEAELLDEWKMKEWVALFTENGTYAVPPIGSPDANPLSSLYLINDNRERLEHRALRLLKKEAHVEYPHSSVVHNVYNVRIVDNQDDVITVKCNFSAYRAKRDCLDNYVGVNEYQLVKEDGELKILSKRVILKMSALRPHGKVSIIL